MKKISNEEDIRRDIKNSKVNLGCNDRDDRIYRSIKSIVDEGSIYYVLTDNPEQTSDIFRILIDNKIVIGFELDRNDPEAAPEEIQTYSVKDYRKAIGRGLAQVKLRIALELAQEELNR